MAYDPQDKPLKPEYSFTSPPWRPSRFDIWSWKFVNDYKGRVSWWTELGYVDPFEVKKIKRLQPFHLIEYDPYLYDPPVKDGESYIGPNSNDSKYTPNFEVKTFQPGNFYEFQKDVMKNSRQYKQVAAKCNLSEEHPGLEVNQSLNALYHQPLTFLGRPLIAPNNYIHRGPRFFDKPINEGCLEKGLCLTKYAALLTLGYSIMHIKAYPPPNMPYTWNLNTILRRYARFLPMPCIMAFATGSSLCTIAAFRKKDDFWNYVILGPFLNLVYTTLRPNQLSLIGFLFSSGMIFFCGTLFQRARYTYPGPLCIMQPEAGGKSNANGPLSWKLFNFGSAEVPKEVY